MPWKVEFNGDHKIIEIKYSGIVTPAELKDAFAAVVVMTKKHNTLLYLADCSEMIGGHSVLDLYALISLFETYDLSRNLKEALVLPNLKSSIEDVKFYETACLNRSYYVKIFSNVHDAVLWLTK